MVQGIRDQTVTKEMVLIAIKVAMVIKIKHMGTIELEVRSTASSGMDGDISIESVFLL